MKIWYHHALPYANVYETYDKILKGHTDMLAGNGEFMTVDHYWNKKGGMAVQYRYLDLMNIADCVENMIKAEKEGYDAAIIGCSMDIGVRESKEVVNIPVVGLAESTMLCACMLGRSFSEITINKKLKVRIEELITELSLEKKCASVRSFEMSLEMAGQALTNSKHSQKVKELFVKECTQAIEKDGAEVIIPGCGLLAALCIKEKITKVEGTEVPVMDTMICSLGMAITLADLKNKVGISVSKAGAFASPSKEAIEKIRKDYQ